mmetsp:Transcript_67122/g.194044  ORF Transcript_67122/g.194044 Transcript_67122/m.194044 type:complete len:288 (+) Transcript_67122:338-1201(+)
MDCGRTGAAFLRGEASASLSLSAKATRVSTEAGMHFGKNPPLALLRGDASASLSLSAQAARASTEAGMPFSLWLRWPMASKRPPWRAEADPEPRSDCWRPNTSSSGIFWLPGRRESSPATFADGALIFVDGALTAAFMPEPSFRTGPPSLSSGKSWRPNSFEHSLGQGGIAYEASFAWPTASSKMSLNSETPSSNHGSNSASAAAGRRSGFRERRFAKRNRKSAVAWSKHLNRSNCRSACMVRRKVATTSAPLKGSRWEIMKKRMTPAPKTSERSEKPWPAITSGAA